MVRKVPVRHTISVRLGDKDLQALSARAEGMGISPSTLARLLIHSALSGEQMLSAPAPRVTTNVLPIATEETTPSLLTHREADILSRIAKGHTSRGIAHALGVSQETIKKDLASVMRKLSAGDRTHAVVLAIRQGHIRPPWAEGRQKDS